MLLLLYYIEQTRKINSKLFLVVVFFFICYFINISSIIFLVPSKAALHRRLLTTGRQTPHGGWDPKRQTGHFNHCTPPQNSTFLTKSVRAFFLVSWGDQKCHSSFFRRSPPMARTSMRSARSARLAFVTRSTTSSTERAAVWSPFSLWGEPRNCCSFWVGHPFYVDLSLIVSTPSPLTKKKKKKFIYLIGKICIFLCMCNTYIQAHGAATYPKLKWNHCEYCVTASIILGSTILLNISSLIYCF